MNKRKEYGLLLNQIKIAESKSALLEIKEEADNLYKRGCLKINEVNHIIQLALK